MNQQLLYLNKRAQRALGRSPEENVKGHSGANNREPQGHNLNNFVVVLDKKIFESFILKTYLLTL